jgi:hypothetical protein
VLIDSLSGPAVRPDGPAALSDAGQAQG